MLYINVDSGDKARSLVKVCKGFKEKYGIEIDIMGERFISNGCSLLSVMSIVGNTIQLFPVTEDDAIRQELYRKVEKIGGYLKNA